MPISKRANIASWILSVLLGLAFLASSFGKLSHQQMNVDNFVRWGYPSWFLTVTGLVEGLSAVLILIPKTRAYGAALLVCTMIGAVMTHLTHGEASFAPVPLVLGILAGTVAWLNREQLPIPSKAGS